MSGTIQLLPFFLLAGAYLLAALCHAVCIRMSARFLFNSILGWQQAFTFAVIIAGTLFVRQASAAIVGVAALRVVGLLFGLLVNLGVGGWYFGTRASTISGQPLGWRRGALLALVAFALLLFIEQAHLWGAAHMLGRAM